MIIAIIVACVAVVISIVSIYFGVKLHRKNASPKDTYTLTTNKQNGLV